MINRRLIFIYTVRKFMFIIFFVCLFVLFFCLFRATPVVYGGSQARSPIGAVATGLCQSHSNARSKPAYARATAMPDPSHIGDLHHSSQQRRILNPLREARDWTHILMDTSQIHFCWATTGTPEALLKTPNASNLISINYKIITNAEEEQTASIKY